MKRQSFLQDLLRTKHAGDRRFAAVSRSALCILISMAVLIALPMNHAYGETEEIPVAMVKALEERSAKITQREKDLKEREERLHLLEEEIRGMIRDFTKLKEEVDQKEAARLSEQNQEKERRIARLAKIYQSMPPKEAANRLVKLKESTVLDLLGRIKEKNAAKILSNLSPSKAAQFSEKFIRVPK